MRNMADVLSENRTDSPLPDHLGSVTVFGGSLLFISLLFCVVLLSFCFVCLRPMACMSNVASISGLSIFDRPFGFL